MESSKVLSISQKGYQDLIGSDGKNLHWTTDIDVELPIKLEKRGPGSEEPITLP